MLRLSILAAVVFSASSVLALTLAAPTEPTVKSEPYVWKSVIIKANGFINGVVYHPHPAAKGLVYINTDMGGAYRLEAAGPEAGKWICLTDFVAHDDWSVNQMGVETLAVDPTNPDRVYLGIGTYMGPSAVLRSSDRGRTWQRTNVPFPQNGNGSARQTGQRLNVDPNFPSRLLYGTRTMGLFTSSDHGATWAKSDALPFTHDPAGATKDTGLVFTLFDPSSGTAGTPTPIAYAAAMTTTDSKLWRTLDAGQSWQPLPNQPTGKILPNRAVLSPDGKRMYVTYVTASDFPGPHGVNGGTVYRIDNPASPTPTYTQIPPTGDGQARYGWSGVSIHPANPNTVYVSTIHRYGNPGDDIYRSTDAGATWTPLNINTNRDDSSAPYVKDFGMHWTGDVQVSPHNPDEAYFTTGYGLYRTTNLTSEKPIWAFYNEGFEQSAVLELVSPPTGSANLLSVIGDRDGYRHENLDVTPPHGRFGQVNDRGQTKSLAMGSTNDIDFATSNPDLLVRVGNKPQFSNDGGFTWAELPTPPDSVPSPTGDGDPFVAEGRNRPTSGTIAISRDGQHVLWAPARFPALHTQRQSDGTWAPWTPVSGLSGVANTAITDLGEESTFYVRVGRSLFASTDNGKTFSLRAGDLPDRPGWLRPVPSQAGHLLLCSGENGLGGLHRSTDGGKTFTRLAPTTVTTAKQVGTGAPPPGQTYPTIFIGGTAGNQRGFFRSDDQGQTWIRINDDNHQYGNIITLNGDSRVHGRLYIGTNGRGILYADKK